MRSTRTAAEDLEQLAVGLSALCAAAATRFHVSEMKLPSS